VRPPRFVLLAVAALGVACGGGGSPTTPSEVASGLTGTWRVTRAEYINATNSAQSVDVIAQGTTMTLVLQAGGTFTLTIVDPGQAANVVTGTWTSSRDVLTIVRTGQSGNSQFDVTLDGNNLTLDGGHVEYDFGNDGQPEEAILNMDLTHG
jgi:hypothetical protein